MDECLNRARIWANEREPLVLRANVAHGRRSMNIGTKKTAISGGDRN